MMMRINESTSDVENDTDGHSRESRRRGRMDPPWQLEWKNPQWTAVDVPKNNGGNGIGRGIGSGRGTGTGTRRTVASGMDTVVVDITMAQLSFQDVPPTVMKRRIVNKQENNKQTSNNDQLDTMKNKNKKNDVEGNMGSGQNPSTTTTGGSSPLVSSGLLLSVTLLAKGRSNHLQQQSTNNNNNDNDNDDVVATDVLLEVIDMDVPSEENCGANNNKATVIMSKRLVWPETVFATTNTNNQGNKNKQQRNGKEMTTSKKGNWFLKLFGIQEEEDDDEEEEEDHGDDNNNTNTDNNDKDHPTTHPTVAITKAVVSSSSSSSARTKIVNHIHDQQQKQQKQQNSHRPVGIVSVTLCRQGGLAGATSTALDMIQSMSMGVMGTTTTTSSLIPSTTLPPSQAQLATTASTTTAALTSPKAMSTSVVPPLPQQEPDDDDDGHGDNAENDTVDVDDDVDDSSRTNAATATPKAADAASRDDGDEGEKVRLDPIIGNSNHRPLTSIQRELRLVCLSRDGKIHVYNPWKLLLGREWDMDNYQFGSDEGGDGKDGKHSSGTFTGNVPSSAATATGGGVSPDEMALDAVTQLFLGHDLFQTLQDHWRPLSEPIATIYPSVFQHDAANPDNQKWILFGVKKEKMKQQQSVRNNEQHSLRGGGHASSSSSPINANSLRSQLKGDDGSVEGPTHGGQDLRRMVTNPNVGGSGSVDSHDVLSQSPPAVKTFLNGPVMDPFMWNPLMETATLVHRTLDNRPQQLSVAGSAYIVVTGNGIPYGRLNHGRRNHPEKEMGTITLNNTQQRIHSKERPATSVPQPNSNSPNAGKHETKKAWWDQSSGSIEGTALHTEVTQESNSGDKEHNVVEDHQSSHDDDDDDDDDDWGDDRSDRGMHNSSVVTEANGGFVTFISTTRWSESRTLFLPFPPRSVSHVAQWNGMELLLVLGESESVAIRMDLASNGPAIVPIGENPFNGETQLSGTAADSTGLPRQASGETIHSMAASIVDESVSSGKNRRFPPSSNFLFIHRYQVLPIETNRTAMSPTPRLLFGSATGVEPPSLLELYVESVSRGALHPSTSAPQHRGLVLLKTFSHFTADGNIVLHHDPTKVAKLDLSPHIETTSGVGQNDEPIMDVWGQHGQGWSILGTNHNQFFICWEGATIKDGAYVKDLGQLPPWMVSPWPQGRISQALRIESADSDIPANTNDASKAIGERLGRSFDPHQSTSAFTPLPSIAQYHRTLDGRTTDRTNSAIDTDLISQAIAALSEPYSTFQSTPNRYSLATPPVIERDSSFITSPPSDIETSFPISYREKSERLLGHCSSWAQLQGTLDDHILLAQQEPVLCFRVGPAEAPLLILTLRKLVVGNGSASPYQQILAWLARRKDFFTAASIALDLLQDRECLFDLWRNADLIGGDLEDTNLEGLVDGIVPIDHAAFLGTATMAHLADMTVGCLIKGGAAMSGTLRMFLQKDESYDPARACLMLAAVTAIALSGDPSVIRVVMGTNDGDWMVVPGRNDELCWPVRCLLQIGIARKYLATAMFLLNATIPDQLRHRATLGQQLDPCDDQKAAAIPDEATTVSLVSLIVASDSSALDLLMDLEDGESRIRYWQSLDDETRMILSLIETDDAFTLLRHPEIRSWVREALNLEIEHSAVPEKGNKDKFSPSVPTDWLQNLCGACLRNGGCDLTDFEIIDEDDAVINVTKFGHPEADVVTNRANRLVIPAGEGESSTVNVEHDDGLKKLRLEIIETRNALMPKLPSHTSDTPAYSLDFDLIVPCLLLLQARGAPWMPRFPKRTVEWAQGNVENIHEQKKKFASTQTLLDATCYLAGRRATFEAKTILTTTKKNDYNDDEANLFAAFDSRTAMRQCFLLKNVSAGASLIGGKNGFILHVCDVLMQELGISMADAESYLLDDQLNLQLVEGCKKDFSSFALSPAHCKLLWLLDEHVLSIKTFGEFETVHMRGRVDPVFASRSIFRAWLSISLVDKKNASKWLSSWLGRRLEICNSFSQAQKRSFEKHENSDVGGHRLACAALARSLIWPSGNSDARHEAKQDDLCVPLASKLEIDKKLLIGICETCVRLVESVPIDALEESL